MSQYKVMSGLYQISSRMKLNTLCANSHSFCRLSSVSVSSKSVLRSLVSLVVIMWWSLGDDFDSFRDWTACIDSVDITLDFQRGFLGPPLRPE